MQASEAWPSALNTKLSDWINQTWFMIRAPVSLRQRLEQNEQTHGPPLPHSVHRFVIYRNYVERTTDKALLNQEKQNSKI